MIYGKGDFFSDVIRVSNQLAWVNQKRDILGGPDQTRWAFKRGCARPSWRDRFEAARTLSGWPWRNKLPHCREDHMSGSQLCNPKEQFCQQPVSLEKGLKPQILQPQLSSASHSSPGLLRPKAMEQPLTHRHCEIINLCCFRPWQFVMQQYKTSMTTSG